MHLRSRTVLAVSLLLSLAACGGEEPVVDPEIGLEGPAELLLHPGSSRSVTLSLQRNETATGEVSFEVSDLPKGVTADFSPPTLPGDGQVTTLTLHAERETDRGDFMVNVRAHGAGLSAERALALEVRGVTVNGQVNSKVPGLPPEPVTVRIGTLSTETDADGAFVLMDVVPPYDLEIQSSNSYDRYVGLASVNPVVTAHRTMPAGSDRLAIATIEGTVSPIPNPDERVEVCAAGGLEVFRSTCATLNPGESAFDLTVQLLRAQTADVQLVARRRLFEEATFVGFNGQAEARVSISAQAPTTVTLTLEHSGSEALSLPLATHGYEDHSVWALDPYGPTYFPEVRFGYGTSVALPMAHLPTSAGLRTGPDGSGLDFSVCADLGCARVPRSRASGFGGRGNAFGLRVRI